ncbi:hypothetical protein B9Z19DRAFT_392862 [Tuber borchii]|uniref:Uncharacterized protein n=1 Tax=Tuber borchii TaxID=42251 RepID=A0A2T6ZHI9_TUBBO|nr:hypothetical protein B9Z19DRAFT_392862 [Tuber borchii]
MFRSFRKASQPAPGEWSWENGDSVCIYPSSSYFLPFSLSCVTLFKFRLLFPFGVYPVSPFFFFFCSCEGWSLFLIFPFYFQVRFLTGPIGVMIHLGFFFRQFSNLVLCNLKNRPYIMLSCANRVSD